MNRRDSTRGERGFALVLSVLLLLMVASLALAGLNTVQRDQQTAGYLTRTRIALQAADAAVAQALENMDQTGTPTVPVTSLGDTSIYPYGLPTFGVDTSAATTVDSLGTGPVSGMNLQSSANGGATFQMQFWRVRVQGNAPGGSVARVEFATGGIVAN